MSIIGFLIAIFTFPGIIFHEWSHELMCNLRDVSVEKVCYFQLDDPVGYVIHETPSRFIDAFLISMAPFIISTFTSVIIFVLVGIFTLNYHFTSNFSYFISIFSVWIGISIGMHAIPSQEDTKNAWNRSIKEIQNKNYLTILVMPIIGIVYVLSVLTIIWMDVIFTVILYILSEDFVMIIINVLNK